MSDTEKGRDPGSESNRGLASADPETRARVARAGGREDLAAHEEFAAGIIEELLPKQMDEAELSALVDKAIAETGATSTREMGKVMAAVMAEGGVRVDGKLASRLVKERLS